MALVSVVGLAILSAILTWPLVMQLRTALPGDPTGDTGVYVWNLWVFRHELLSHGHLPFSTEHVFAFTGGADFSLHNYTPLAGLVAVPLIPWLGVVGTYNAVLLLAMATSGWGVFVLSRFLGHRPLAAWCAGALFMATPLLSARETAHLSLVTNAALPLFLWALLRALDQPRRRDGVLIGLIVAIATLSDAYYGIYCVLMGAFIVGWRFLEVSYRPAAASPWSGRWTVAASAALIVAAVVPRLFGVDTVEIGAIRIRGLGHPYSLMLLLVIVALVRTWRVWRPSVRQSETAVRPPGLTQTGLIAVGVCLLILSPLLVGIAMRYVSGRLPATVSYWRSSPRGVDLLAYLVPNPVHALFGPWTERWLLPEVEDAFPELVASCSLVALAGIAVAARQRLLPRMWLIFTAAFVLLSLGPFVHIGGVNTFVIGPWALLRYVPIIGMARSPSRFAIVAALGIAVLFGAALDGWLADRRRWRVVGVAALVTLIAFEVVPGSRPLHSAAVPEVYRLLATSGDEAGRLLELPTGIRDGTSSVGDFNASAAFFQTTHHRPLIGGYLSRVSDWRRTESLKSPMLRVLYQLSNGSTPIDAETARAAVAARDTFLARSCVQYVVVDKRRASAELRRFATDALRLVTLHEDDRYELLAPTSAPPCERRRGGGAPPWTRRAGAILR